MCWHMLIVWKRGHVRVQVIRGDVVSTMVCAAFIGAHVGPIWPGQQPCMSRVRQVAAKAADFLNDLTF
jgi:hypothetical protein